MERPEVWHLENLGFKHAPFTPQEEGPTQGMCVVLAETSEGRVLFHSLHACGKVWVWGGVSERKAEGQSPLPLHPCLISAKSIVYTQ